MDIKCLPEIIQTSGLIKYGLVSEFWCVNRGILQKNVGRGFTRGDAPLVLR